LELGVPYGNSVQLPFVKQFFVGGNNSLRGFRSRQLARALIDIQVSLIFYLMKLVI
jgi:outer membrane protein assembly factor BamA